jgi:hypothetical protein
METRQRRSFTDDYKRQAVDLVASSGRSIGSVAKELGLRDSVLQKPNVIFLLTSKASTIELVVTPPSAISARSRWS